MGGTKCSECVKNDAPKPKRSIVQGMGGFGLNVFCGGCKEEKYGPINTSHRNPSYDPTFDVNSAAGQVIVTAVSNQLKKHVKNSKSKYVTEENMLNEEDIKVYVTKHMTTQTYTYEGKGFANPNVFFIFDYSTLNQEDIIVAMILLSLVRAGANGQRLDFREGVTDDDKDVRSAYMHERYHNNVGGCKDRALANSKLSNTCAYCPQEQGRCVPMMAYQTLLQLPCWTCMAERIKHLCANPKESPLTMHENAEGTVTIMNFLYDANSDKPWEYMPFFVLDVENTKAMNVPFICMLAHLGILRDDKDTREIVQALHDMRQKNNVRCNRDNRERREKMNQEIWESQDKNGVPDLSSDEQEDIKQNVRVLLDSVGKDTEKVTVAGAAYAGVYNPKEQENPVFCNWNEPIAKWVVQSRCLFVTASGDTPQKGKDVIVTYLTSGLLKDPSKLQEKITQLTNQAETEKKVAVIVIALHRPVSQRTTRKAEENTIVIAQQSKLLSTEGEGYLPGNSSKITPYAQSFLVLSIGIIEALKSGRLYFNHGGTACFRETVMKQLPSLARDMNKWKCHRKTASTKLVGTAPIQAFLTTTINQSKKKKGSTSTKAEKVKPKTTDQSKKKKGSTSTKTEKIKPKTTDQSKKRKAAPAGGTSSDTETEPKKKKGLHKFFGIKK